MKTIKKKPEQQVLALALSCLQLTFESKQAHIQSVSTSREVSTAFCMSRSSRSRRSA